MSNKHTPGPWEIDHAFKKSTIITNDTDMVICQIHGSSPGATADGRLIAAAPELLEASMKVLEWFEAEDDHSKADFYQRIQMCCDAEEMIRAAIAKATGGTA